MTALTRIQRAFGSLIGQEAKNGAARELAPGSGRLGARDALWLTAILLLALALRVGLAIKFPRIHHPDEVYQYLEQGHRVAFGYGVIPWEYRDGARLWLLPAAIAGLMKVTQLLGGGPSAYMLVIAVALSALSLSVVAVAYLWVRRLAGRNAAILAGAITATWFELIYFAPKPFSEVVATYALVTGLYLALSGERRSLAALAAGGVLLGLALILRIQLAPAIGLAALVVWGTKTWDRSVAVMLGLVAVTLVAGALDWWTWGTPFHSFTTYLRATLVPGGGGVFCGVSPWYQYLALYVLEWAGALVPVALLAIPGARRQPLFLAIPLVIVLSHSAIAHKEFRFVFPAVPFILMAASMGAARLVELITRERRLVTPGLATLVAAIAWATTSAASAIGTHFRPLWSQGSDYIAAFEELRSRPAVCGVGLVGVRWVYTSGYSYLHREIPLIVAPGLDELSSLRQGFNAALAPVHYDLARFGYRFEHCYPSAYIGSQLYPAMCLHVRDGPCAAVPDHALNKYLIATGE